MAEVAVPRTAPPLLRSPAVSFIVTTAFNFVSISIILWATYASIKSTIVATVAAHALGMLVSMAFCLDWWWTRVSHQMQPPVTMSQRARFLGIATVAAFVATAVVRLGTMDAVRSSTFLIFLNWVGLGLIALIKYILMLALVPNVRRFMSARVSGLNRPHEPSPELRELSSKKRKTRRL